MSPLQQHPQQQKQASSKKGTGGRSGALSMEDALGPFRRGTEEDNQFFDMDTDDPFKVSGGVVWTVWKRGHEPRPFLWGRGGWLGGGGGEDQEGGKEKGARRRLGECSV